MTKKWIPVVKLLRHMIDDDNLMARWGIIEAGDVRGTRATEIMRNNKKSDLFHLLMAVEERANDRPKSTGDQRLDQSPRVDRKDPEVRLRSEGSPPESGEQVQGPRPGNVTSPFTHPDSSEGEEG